MESLSDLTKTENHICAEAGYSNEITIEDIDEVIQRDFGIGCPTKEQKIESSLASEFDSHMAMESRHRLKPSIKILIQPASKALRFRYECEGRSAGSLPGANSTSENKTFPTIQIVNCKTPAVVVVSCVTKDPPYRPHPHKLVGKDGCKKGVCTIQVSSENMTCTFSNLGIQCVKKRDIEDALKEREELRVDPFRTGFDHKNQASNIDLNAVRLCFQAFVEGPEKGKFGIPLDPVVSDPIFDKKAMSDLVISKLSCCSGTVKGGTEIILLCEKIAKDDIEIRFYEENINEEVEWEAFGDFTPNDVHKQVAIAFKTPPYRDINIQHPVEVRMQLRRRSDLTASESRTFQYSPMDPDPEMIEAKRKKVVRDGIKGFISSNINLNFGSPQRSILRPHRPNIKKEPPSEAMRNPTFPFDQCPMLDQPSTLFYQMPVQQNPLPRPMQISPNPSPMNIAPPTTLMPPVEPSHTYSLNQEMNIPNEEPNYYVMETQMQPMNFIPSSDKNPQPSQTDEVLTTSLDLNLSIDSSELNSILRVSELNSFQFSSLESGAQETPDSLTNLQNEIMALNQLGETSQSHSQMQ